MIIRTNFLLPFLELILILLCTYYPSIRYPLQMLLPNRHPYLKLVVGLHSNLYLLVQFQRGFSHCKLCFWIHMKINRSGSTFLMNDVLKKYLHVNLPQSLNSVINMFILEYIFNFLNLSFFTGIIYVPLIQHNSKKFPLAFN